jgi:hypothetical protein
MIRLIALLAVAACLPACGGQEPAPETAATPALEPAAGEEARPCAAFVEEAQRCAAEAEAAGRSPTPEVQQSLADGLREDCRGWLTQGVTRDELFGALDRCRSTSCSDGPADWYGCVTAALPAEAMAEPTMPAVDSSTWTRITPRPLDDGAEPCMTFISWTTECVREALDGQPLPPEAETAMRDAYLQACDAFKSGGMYEFLPLAFRACIDVGCGEAGADLMMCIVQELTQAMGGGAAGTPAP